MNLREQIPLLKEAQKHIKHAIKLLERTYSSAIYEELIHAPHSIDYDIKEIKAILKKGKKQ
jgi:hypothetical protein